MTTLEIIERQIAALSPSELEQFRAWFDAYEAREWDEQIARDARAGKLEKLADRAKAEHQAGRSRQL